MREFCRGEVAVFDSPCSMPVPVLCLSLLIFGLESLINQSTSLFWYYHQLTKWYISLKETAAKITATPEKWPFLRLLQMFLFFEYLIFCITLFAYVNSRSLYSRLLVITA